MHQVPCYAFNQDRMWDAFVPLARYEVVQKFYRNVLKMAPVVFLGRFGVVLGMPQPVRTALVVGRPVQTKNLTIKKIDFKFSSLLRLG